MIYIVEFRNRALAETEGAYLITMSGDGTAAMMHCEHALSVEVIGTHAEEEKQELMSQEFWRQPCVNC
jgi:hypothetical protein